jgi:DNA-binding Lrp family transcriptional regulator
VLVDVASGAINDVINNLQQLPNVTEVYQLSGLHDILVKVDANSTIKFKELISSTIQRLDYVQSTTNLIVMPNSV